jgi:DNA-binding transcriptional LysR family regulator
MPTDLVRDALAAGRLVPILANWQMLTLPICLIHPSRRVTALMDVLAEALRTSHPI